MTKKPTIEEILGGTPDGFTNVFSGTVRVEPDLPHRGPFARLAGRFHGWRIRRWLKRQRDH